MSFAELRDLADDSHRRHILGELRAERQRQIEKWGDQSHPDGTFNTPETRYQRDFDRHVCQLAAEEDVTNWRLILQEEISEAFAETDWPKLRAELVQCAAVIVAWIENGDTRA